ncbi:LptF/LptG family permease [Adhaeribacter radiodurans]|uniref:YjgP/YjgQ family permease n=1 Tax=Adhaeribacter radiodurans TaxID=2745197 RepID=A0A7L7L480_9BACT|nr:LptF/LptG family permease [Adhaeribacter radiodurans]QMU27179.1 YjgP/YjgQ family permease [Adhaeribacter radiodurans]
MKLLDKYILKKYLSTFVFVVLILVVIICVIDFTEKNDDFLETNPPFKSIIFDYYLNLIPFYSNMLSPITVFIATVFVTAKLAGRTEIVAILSSGVSFRRMLWPYVMGAIVIGAFTFAMIGWVIPNSNKTRVAFEVKYIKKPYTFEGRNIHFKLNPESYAYIESYNNTANIGYKFTLETIKGNELLAKLTSDAITWDEKKNKWHLDNYVLRKFEGDREITKQYGPIDTTLNLLPKDFASTYRLAETLTLPELNKFINQKKMRGADDTEIYLIEKYERFSYPFAIIILTTIGVILSSRKRRGGIGLQVALGFTLAFIFIIFVIMSRSFAQVGDVSPMLASWIPSIIFTFIGIILYKTVPR